jgi:hypothetical protein
MSDELKTILEIDGDASGAARAVDQAKSKLAELPAAAGGANAGAADAAVQTTAALDGQTAATEKLSDETENLNEGLDVSRRDLMGLASVLVSIDPRLAAIIRDFARLRSLLAILSSPTLLTGAGFVAVAGAIVVAFNAVSNSVEEAKRHLDEVATAMERVRQAGKEVESQVAKSMAAAGQPPAATPVATGIAKRLEAAGIERATAAKAVPFFVTETGEKLGTPEEQELIAAGIQAGILKPMEGTTPQQRNRAFKKARREVDRHRQAVENARAQTNAAETERLYQDAARGGLTEIQKIVEQETGLAGDEAAALAKRISRQAKEGPKRLPRVPGGKHMVSESDVAEWLADRGILERVPVEPEEPLLRIIRQRAGVPQPPFPTPATQLPPPPPFWERRLQETRDFDKWVQSLLSHSPKSSATQPATQPAPVSQTIVHETVQNFHGPTYVGRPGDRFTTHERFPQ